MRARLAALILAAGLGIVLAFGLGTGPAVAQFSFLGLKNNLVQFVLDQISVPGEFEITADRVEEPDDGSTAIVGLAIADGDGVWLRIGSLSLNWNATRILRGEIDIQSLAAADVEVLRRPNAAPEVKEDAEIAETDDDPFDWPRSPLTLNVAELRLDRVDVAPGVIGEPGIAFNATGAARDEGDEQSARLVLTRTDAVSGRIVLDYLRRFEESRLKLDLDAQEAPGGLVVTLGGLPNDSASRVKIQADGPLDNWDMTLTAGVDRVIDVTGRASVDLVDRIGLEAALNVEPGEAIEPKLREVLAPRSTLAFRVEEDEQGQIAIRQGSITSPALSLDATGSYDRSTTFASLAVQLQGDAALSELVEGVAFEGFGFDGRVTGPTDRLTAEGNVYLDALATDAADVGEARLTATVGVEGERIAFNVDGRVGGLRLDRLTPELLGDADLQAAGVFDAGVLSLDGVFLGARPLTVNASGRVDTNAPNAELAYSLAAPELGPLARAYDVAAGGALEVEGAVSGPFDAIGIKGFARLARMVFEGESYGAVTLDHDLLVDESPGGTVRVTTADSPFGAAEVDADFELAGEVFDLSRLTARVLGASLDGAVRVDLGTQAMDGRVALAVPDMATLNPVTEKFAGERVAGRLGGEVALASGAEGQGVRADLALDGFRGFEAEVVAARVVADIADALGTPSGTVEVTVDDVTHPQGGVDRARIAAVLEDLAGLGSAAVTFAVEGAGMPGTVEVASLEGTADITDLTGSPGVVLGADVRGIAAEGAATVEAVRLDADLADLTGAPGGDLSFRVTGIDAAGAARVAEVTGEGSFADATGTPNGKIAIAARRIDASGTAIPSVTLDAALTEAGVLDAVLSAPSVSQGEVLTVTAAKVTARVADALGAAPSLEIRAGVARVEAAPVTLEAPVVTVKGPLSAIALAADANGSFDDGRNEAQPIALRLRARADAASPAVRATVSELAASLGPAAVSLNRPLAIAAEGGTTRLRDLDLALPGGGVTGALTSFANGLGTDLTLVLADFPALASALEPLGVELPVSSGRIELAADLDTRPGAARADVTLSGRDLELGEKVGDIGTLALDASTRWDGRRADVETALSGPFGDPVRLTAALPLRPTGQIVPQVPAGGEIDGRLVWNGDLGDLWALVPAADHILDGRLAIDLALTGPVDAPQIGGTLGMSEGQYQNLETGTILTHINMGSELDGTGGIVLELDARDGAKGELGARIALDPETLDATITAKRAVLVRRDDVKAMISTDIAAKGPLTAPAISGKVVIDKAEIRLVNQTPPSVADLGEVRFKGDPEPEEKEPAGGDIALDIRIEAPRDIFVRGRGLDSEWKIGLDVTGTAARPAVVGAVERLRGRLDLLGRDFDLEEGEVRFSGGREIDPILNVKLAHDREGFIGRIEVTGNASKPQIAFTSDPSVPEEEVLPRTIFGQSSQSLSPTDALLLANAVATLLDGGEGLAGGIRSAAGIDVLRIDEDDSGASVTVGKNVADGVFIGAKQPIGGGSATIEVEVDVFGDFTVDAEIGQEEGSSVGINWRKDF